MSNEDKKGFTVTPVVKDMYMNPVPAHMADYAGLTPEACKAQRMAELAQIAAYRAEKLAIIQLWSKDPVAATKLIEERAEKAKEMIMKHLAAEPDQGKRLYQNEKPTEYELDGTVTRLGNFVVKPIVKPVVVPKKLNFWQRLIKKTKEFLCKFT